MHLLLLACFILSSLSAIAAEPPTPAADAVRMMQLPPGFKATLFAAEPDVRNPIAMCWDQRGRLWIAENLTYSDQAERFDMKLRDRILIFEDEDNDGHFDTRTVFADDLPRLTSIERGFGGVYALCPPHLLFIPTQDDKPSGPPEILLDGFNTEDGLRHCLANGLKWGPEGWLYGRIGITSTSWIGVPGSSRESRQLTAGGIWRYHPTRKICEPYCHGTTNPWGMDWNEDGEMFFVNTVIGHLWHGIQGAHFKRMMGEDPYPYVYDLIDQHADHYHWDTGKKWNESHGGTGLTDTLGGGHAHVGLTIYQGCNFPPEYRGKAFTTNLHGRRINIDRLDRQGSGYVGKHEPDFMKTTDPWFRAVEISYGPDGGLYVLDWSDTGECHENDGVHRNSGRIYKITYGDPARAPEADLTQLSDEALVQLQLHDNEWLVRMARWELRERQSNGRLTPAGMKATGELKRLASGSPKQQNFDWALAWLGIFPDENINTSSIEAVTRAESSAPLRLKWASRLQQLPTQAKINCARGLLSHAGDATDHNLPLMIWYGIRDLPPDELVKIFPDCQIPLVRQLIARRICEDIDVNPAPLNTLLSRNPGEFAPDILFGMTTALKGWRTARKPDAWDRFVESASENNACADPLRNLGVLFGSGRALDEVRAIVLSKDSPAENRSAALLTLIASKPPDLRSLCESLIEVDGLSATAIQGLATFDDPTLAEKIVGRYPTLALAERPQAIAALASRPSFARVLLSHVNGIIPRRDISSLTARQIRGFNDPALTNQLTETWGATRESSAAKTQLIESLKTKLTPEFIHTGDPSQGRVLFSALCASCHKLYGEGGVIGPDLTGSGRHEIQYLIENLADPNAVVAADYALTVVTLKDGRVLSGTLGARTARTLAIRMISGETTVDLDEIANEQRLPVSIMPEGLPNSLNDAQLAHLISYLMSSQQVPSKQ
jgi:putative membrane-bound dehydrogenase-like protein